MIETNDLLRSDPSLLSSSDAGWSGFLAIFSLAAKHRTLLSVEDRMVEGSEAERDVAEDRPVNRDPALVLPDTPASSNQSLGSELGAEWRSFLEYLTPTEYAQRRKHMFI